MKNWFTLGYLGLGSVICTFFLIAVAAGWETGWKMPKFKSSSRHGYHSYGSHYSSGRSSGGFFGGK